MPDSGLRFCKFFHKLVKNLAEMIGKIDKNPQLEMFKVPLHHLTRDTNWFCYPEKLTVHNWNLN